MYELSYMPQLLIKNAPFLRYNFHLHACIISEGERPTVPLSLPQAQPDLSVHLLPVRVTVVRAPSSLTN